MEEKMPSAIRVFSLAIFVRAAVSLTAGAYLLVGVNLLTMKTM